MRSVTQLIGETDERKFKKILLAEVDASLEVLASMDINAEDDPEDGEGDE
jgi:phage terminase Nu1 subunit (DNA packaging protein)